MDLRSRINKTGWKEGEPPVQPAPTAGKPRQEQTQGQWERCRLQWGPQV